jgi:hypothetical protein
MLVKKALLVSNHSPMTSDPYFPFYGAWHRKNLQFADTGHPWFDTVSYLVFIWMGSSCMLLSLDLIVEIHVTQLVLSWHMPGGTEESHKKSSSGWLVSQLWFKSN